MAKKTESLGGRWTQRDMKRLGYTALFLEEGLGCQQWYIWVSDVNNDILLLPFP